MPIATLTKPELGYRLKRFILEVRTQKLIANIAMFNVHACCYFSLWLCTSYRSGRTAVNLPPIHLSCCMWLNETMSKTVTHLCVIAGIDGYKTNSYHMIIPIWCRWAIGDGENRTQGVTSCVKILSAQKGEMIFSTRKSVDKVWQILILSHFQCQTNTAIHPMTVSDSGEVNLKNSLPEIFNFHACSSVSLNIIIPVKVDNSVKTITSHNGI